MSIRNFKRFNENCIDLRDSLSHIIEIENIASRGGYLLGYISNKLPDSLSDAFKPTQRRYIRCAQVFRPLEYSRLWASENLWRGEANRRSVKNIYSK